MMHTTTARWPQRPSAGASELARIALRRAGARLGRVRKRDRARGDAIAIAHGDSSWINAYAWRAAAPRVAMHDLGDAWRLELNAPGATAKNTSVGWDASAQSLIVAVWCGPPPDPRRRYSPPELAWLRRFRLPTADFNRAEARVHRGLVTIEAPRREPPRASWEPPPPL